MTLIGATVSQSTSHTNIKLPQGAEGSLQKFYYPDPVEHSTIKHWLFADLLPWQQQTWAYLTTHFDRLPHAMLFAGNAGTGKRAFVYRFVAWALCERKTFNSQNIATACGQCESCQWLLAGTHPNLYQIPKPNTPQDVDTAKKPKTPPKTFTKIVDESPTHQSVATIKIDEIRELQPFVLQSSGGMRIVVIHQADVMTLAASNALLKTLEEPADNVLILLLSDTPSQLLPTIRSRLQAFNVSQVVAEQSLTLMQTYLPDVALQALREVNLLSGFAPFVAMQMLVSQWYQHRQTWIKSWQAVRSRQRSVIQASDYWQKTLTLSDFLYLSQLMITQLSNQLVGLQNAQSDINFEKLQPLPTLLKLLQLQKVIDEAWQDRQQNLQDKLCYDKVINTMQNI